MGRKGLFFYFSELLRSEPFRWCLSVGIQKSRKKDCTGHKRNAWIPQSEVFLRSNGSLMTWWNEPKLYGIFRNSIFALKALRKTIGEHFDAPRSMRFMCFDTQIAHSCNLAGRLRYIQPFKTFKIPVLLVSLTMIPNQRKFRSKWHEPGACRIVKNRDFFLHWKKTDWI